MLHLIELLLRHIVGYYVGETSGPEGFKSDLGKAIVDLSSPITVVRFEKIACANFPILPDEVLKVRKKNE